MKSKWVNSFSNPCRLKSTEILHEFLVIIQWIFQNDNFLTWFPPFLDKEKYDEYKSKQEKERKEKEREKERERDSRKKRKHSRSPSRGNFISIFVLLWLTRPLPTRNGRSLASWHHQPKKRKQFFVKKKRGLCFNRGPFFLVFWLTWPGPRYHAIHTHLLLNKWT